MRIIPREDFVLVEPVSDAKQTPGGIYIPDSANEHQPRVGKVTAVGPGKMLDDKSRLPMTLRVGETVAYREYSSSEVEYNGQKILLIPQSAVMALIDES